MVREFFRFDIDIVVFSEVRFVEEGLFVEYGVGYIFFWSGRGKEERR